MPAVPATVAGAAGAKRKRTSEPKFYAVRIGHRPGVYAKWDDCMAQIKGFKNATFKSYPTMTDAEKFVAGQNPRRPGDNHRPTRYYAVKVGRNPGIYADWEQAQKQIKGWKAPKHRCFASKNEAQLWLNESDEPVDSGTSSPHWPLKQSMDEVESSLPPTTKKSKKQSLAASTPGTMARANNGFASSPVFDGYEPGFVLPPDVKDGFDTNIVYNPTTGNVIFKTPAQRTATKLKATTMKANTPMRIHTDGSSLKNGQADSLAGVGVFFGPNDTRNVSETLGGSRQTNQRAELTAIIRALDIAPRDRDVVIVTDSQYSINCVTKWADSWRRNGWKTTTGKAVENKDLVEGVTSRMDERAALGSRTVFEWIKGHANHAGNVEADKLAVNAAKAAAASLSARSAVGPDIQRPLSLKGEV